MTNLVLAALFLPLSHFLVSSTPLRPWLVQCVGERRYRTAYSLLALAAFSWLIAAYVQAPKERLWQSPLWLTVGLGVMALSGLTLAIFGLTTRNPVIGRLDALFSQPDIVRGVLRITRNPFFWGVGLFAAAHAAFAGHLEDLLTFGSVALLGLAGGVIMDARKARTASDGWTNFDAATSNVPFLAIAQGRQHFVWREIGIWRLTLALAACVIFLAGHWWL
jgi:uncharacterized membrane protein